MMKQSKTYWKKYQQRRIRSVQRTKRIMTTMMYRGCQIRMVDTVGIGKRRWSFEWELEAKSNHAKALLRKLKLKRFSTETIIPSNFKKWLVTLNDNTSTRNVDYNKFWIRYGVTAAAELMSLQWKFRRIGSRFW